MRWKGRKESSNVEDRRGMSGGAVAAGGGGVDAGVAAGMRDLPA